MLVQILTFMIVANPATYKLVRGVLGGWVSNAEGRATTAGLFVHALVFVFLAGLLMRLLGGYVSKYEPAPLGDNEASDMSWMSTPAPAEAEAPAPAPEAVSTDYSNLFSSVLGDSGMKNFDQ